MIICLLIIVVNFIFLTIANFILEILVLFVSIIFYLGYRNLNGRPVLEVNVGAIDGDKTYMVKTKELVDGMFPIEHVRHYVHYLTKLIFLSNNQKDYVQKAMIELFIFQIADLDVINEENIFDFNIIKLNNKLSAENSIVSTLNFINIHNRRLHIKLPPNYNLICSANALLIYNCRILDSDHLNYLLGSIKFLNNILQSGNYLKDNQSMETLANIAFLNRER